MAEPIGLAVGVLGLAGLFSATLEAWSFVDAGRAHAKSFSMLRTKLDGQRVLFMIWGKKMGFGSAEGYDKRLNDPSVRPTIEQILNEIRRLFSDTDALVKKYGIKVVEKKTSEAESMATSRAVFKPNYDSFLRMVNDQQSGIVARFKRLLNFLRRRRKRVSFRKVIKWSIRDEKKFEAMVRDLAELLRQLKDLTEDLGILTATLADLAMQEVAEIHDDNVLKEIQDATVQPNTILSSAVSTRRLSIESSRAVSRSNSIAGPAGKERFSGLVNSAVGRSQRQSDDSVRPASHLTDASFKTAWSLSHDFDVRSPHPRYASMPMPPLDDITELSDIEDDRSVVLFG
ncbi:hypothetical protein DL769_011468 [Monosporascus sp. CRB-8-3]|nr:hypothetical protein DL769_011468 [Monosporascus sp. CRB-8-3]